MNSPAKAHEPTMEEILASIRRIISDDDKGPERAEAPKPVAAKIERDPPAKPASEPVGQDDIDALFATAETKPVGQDDIDALFASAEAEPVGQDDIDALFATADAEAAAPKASPKVPDVSSLADDLDVLELTEEMAEPAPVASKPAPKPQPAPQAARPDPAPKGAFLGDQGLISAAVGEQVSNAFGSLAHTVLAGNAKTLDDIVRDMLRPMLKAWLDDNLPPMVERLVRAEIERVARGGR